MPRPAWLTSYWSSLPPWSEEEAPTPSSWSPTFFWHPSQSSNCIYHSMSGRSGCNHVDWYISRALTSILTLLVLSCCLLVCFLNSLESRLPKHPGRETNLLLSMLRLRLVLNPGNWKLAGPSCASENTFPNPFLKINFVFWHTQVFEEESTMIEAKKSGVHQFSVHLVGCWSRQKFLSKNQPPCTRGQIGTANAMRRRYERFRKIIHIRWILISCSSSRSMSFLSYPRLLNSSLYPSISVSLHFSIIFILANTCFLSW